MPLPNSQRPASTVLFSFSNFFITWSFLRVKRIRNILLLGLLGYAPSLQIESNWTPFIWFLHNCTKGTKVRELYSFNLLDCFFCTFYFQKLIRFHWIVIKENSCGVWRTWNTMSIYAKDTDPAFQAAGATLYPFNDFISVLQCNENFNFFFWVVI